jgi:hypothetical protein
LKKNKQVEEAINEVVDEIKESTEFKQRLLKLIDQILEKPIEHTYLDDDIREVIDLIDLSKEGLAKR